MEVERELLELLGDFVDYVKRLEDDRLITKVDRYYMTERKINTIKHALSMK